MNFIKFLGTAGARFVVTRQLRKSGGIWISIDDTNLLIDPGPGSLVRCLASKPKLRPITLDGIILTHRHIDHSNDINIIIEAMTNGGYKKKGTVFLPNDAIKNDPVILHHFREHIEKIEILEEKKEYNINNIHFSIPVKLVHGVQSYGLNVYSNKNKISFISDTKYFEKLETYFKGDILILNVVLLEPNSKIMHLSIKDAEKIITKNKPKLSILTHFGLNVIRSKPWIIAEELTEKTGTKVIAASDGMSINIDDIKNLI